MKLAHVRKPLHATTALLAAVLIGGLLVNVVDAASEPLAYESFEPANVGDFLSSNKGDRDWSTYGGAIVDDKDLTYSAGTVLADGGDRALFVDGPQDNNGSFTAFSFAEQTNDVYFSFLASTTAGVFFQPYVSDDADTFNSGSAILDARSGDDVCARLSFDSAAHENSDDIGDSQGLNPFIVGKLSKSGAGNYDTLEMLVNPTSDVEPATWDCNITCDIGIDYIKVFGIRIYNVEANEDAWIDEIRIGTTFAAVVPPVPKGTMVSIK